MKEEIKRMKSVCDSLTAAYFFGYGSGYAKAEIYKLVAEKRVEMYTGAIRTEAIAWSDIKEILISLGFAIPEESTVTGMDMLNDGEEPPPFVDMIQHTKPSAEDVENARKSVGLKSSSDRFREALENLSHSQKLFNILHDLGLIAVESEMMEIVNVLKEDIMKTYNEIYKLRDKLWQVDITEEE